MTDYKAPLRDLNFTYLELFDYPEHYKKFPQYAETDRDLMESIFEEYAKFAENVLVPIYRSGDEEGCTWHEDGSVTTPKGYKEAYQQYVEMGWPSMTHSADHGGQGLPESVGLAIAEITSSANQSFGMYPGLSHGAMRTIEAHGTEKQIHDYLGKLITGEWTGTMCLTESHCGTDLGLLRSKAEPNADGSYNITGQKIFISAGEHDMSENIVHIVLARLPDAPKGTKGISLFIVPKFNLDENGNVGERNAVNCGSIEHKMGINANATAVLNFDGAKGFLIGPPNKGLRCMFTFINTSRMGVATQGQAHAELGFQKSLAYAKDRVQMRALGKRDNPESPADPIIVHPDVRRMLLTQKVFAEGGRMFTAYMAKYVDIQAAAESEEERKAADDRLALLTPIAKAFMSETGFESANHGLQCYGGHGFIREWGMEQNVRDARISMLYEGTTGVQAIDLLGRKVLGTRGKVLKPYIKEIEAFCDENKNHDSKIIEALIKQVDRNAGKLTGFTRNIGLKALKNPEEVGAASFDYLMFAGYLTYGYLWAKAAVKAQEILDAGTADNPDFYKAKIQTAEFYWTRIMPRSKAHSLCLESGSENLMQMNVDAFAY
ncbi:MAG: acyl-CoA dehydrogenase C-terminal domain-containing protein [Gammaproteobacteria bacterium]|nr:acyl-CoA dehydrogenase C-terminal domain-containing protein [Gammaproteobacteria bacterium]